MNRNKRSQMEAFGLAVIVILISLGLFIVLVLKYNSPQKEPMSKEYIYDELAVNFINTIINVDVKECYSSSRTLSELVRDCAKRSATTCSGKDACVLANETIHKLLNQSLTTRRHAFNFVTDGLNWPNSGDEISVITYNCTSDSDSGQMGIFPVSLYPEPRVVYLKLKICKQ